MSVLFSCVGFTDPISKYYNKETKETIINDGPILHMLRHNKDITDCYLFCSKDITEQIEKYDIYKMAIEHLAKTYDRQIKVHYFKSKVEKANNYDTFYSFFAEKLSDIKEKHPGEKIYINLTSGTQQMTSSLLLLSSIENNGVPLQADNPHFNNHNLVKQNRVTVTNEKELSQNLDNFNNEKRISFPELLVQHNFNSRQKIIQSIKNYDYDFALHLYKNSSINNSNLEQLLEHLVKRKKLEDSTSNGILDNNEITSNVELYPNYGLMKNKQGSLVTKSKILEYYNIVKTLYYSNKIDEFLVTIMVLMLNIQMEILNKLLYVNISNLMFKGKITRRCIEQSDGSLLDLLDNKYNRGGYKDSFPSNEVLSIINDYYLTKKNHPHKDKILSIIYDIDNLRQDRNQAAHELSFSKKEQLDNNNEIGCSIEQKFLNLEFLLKLLYPDVKDSYFNLYNDINVYLEKILK